MQIHIDTSTDGPNEYRAARAALNELLLPVSPSVIDEPDVQKLVDDFRAVVQAEDDAEAAAAFAPELAVNQPLTGAYAVQTSALQAGGLLGVNLNPPPTVTIAGVTAEYLPGSADPAAQYQALGGTLPDVDKHGIPWDVRIHAGGKTKNADGSWRGKRGVSSDIVNAVTAELKARGGKPAAAAPAVSPPMNFAALGPVPPHPSAPQPDAYLAGIQAHDAPPPPSGPTFMDVTEANMAAIAAGKWTAAQAVTLAQTLGLESIAGLQGRPDLIPAYLASVPAAA